MANNTLAYGFLGLETQLGPHASPRSVCRRIFHAVATVGDRAHAPDE
jgi:hypothetical protein